jgi:hypothetical protein
MFMPEEPRLEKLYKWGATTARKKLHRIENIETANYLKQAGMLPDILRTRGSRILAAAISADKEDLVQWATELRHRRC